MNRNRFQVQKKDVIILAFFLFIIIGFTYVWTSYHQKIKREWYTFQIPLIKSTIHCSKNAPTFMYELMNETVVKQKSMSNQLVYLTSKGQMYHCESGWEDGFSGTRLITDNSRFLYASVSKTVTSAMIIDLINQGKINLNQKLVDIISIPSPEDERINKITIEMLLQHSAGFDRMKTFTPMLTVGKKPWCPTNIEHLSKVKLDFDPNTQFQYSNVGYCLLGAIVEKVTGLSFKEAVERKYEIDKRGIKFINHDFLMDEVKYDYRNEVFYGKSWRKKFDFPDSLAAVGGLSGSAKSMTLLMKDMIDELKDGQLNMLSSTKSPCAINLSEGCYGYVFESYQAKGKNFTIYNKSGYFPGVEADIFVDDHGGILTVIRGATTPDRESLTKFRKKVYDSLLEFYLLGR